MASASPRPVDQAPAEAAPEQELAFINISDKPANGWRATNKTVRAHVMRRYKREQRIQSQGETVSRCPRIKNARNSRATGSASPGSSSARPVDSHPDDVSASESSLETQTVATVATMDDSLVDLVAHASPVSSWLDGSLDPFSCLPIPSTPHMLMLLQQNALTNIRTSVHADPDDLWRRSCSINAAWLYMTLFFASSRFPETARLHPEESSRYLVQSIAAVNETISRSPNQIDDSTMATVACLANIDSLNGVSSDATIHANGLRRMVELRGGLNRLGLRGILRRMVLWSDLLASSRLGRPPSFPFWPVDSSLALSVSAPLSLSHFTPGISPDLYRLDVDEQIGQITTVATTARYGGTCMSLVQLLTALHELSTFLSYTAAVHSGHLPWDAAYPDRVYAVEHHLLSVLFDDELTLTASTEDQLAMGHLLLHAGLLFIYTNLRETPVGGAIRCRLLRRLRRALESCPLARESETFVAERFWMLLLGASTCVGPDQDYFIGELQQMSQAHAVYTWPDVSRLLRTVPALETRRLQSCVQLWNMFICSMCND